MKSESHKIGAGMDGAGQVVEEPARGASAILELLQHVRVLAEAEGEDEMANHINAAFNSCLMHYISENEMRLAARLRQAN